MLCTELAARGIDIKGVEAVKSFNKFSFLVDTFPSGYQLRHAKQLRALHSSRGSHSACRSRWKVSQANNPELTHSPLTQTTRSVTLVADRDRSVLQQIIAHCKKDTRSSLKNRVLPPQLILKYQERIQSFDKALRQLNEEEKQDKQVHKSVMSDYSPAHLHHLCVSRLNEPLWRSPKPRIC
jgi:superfamily II DNA/RNA helicase